MGTRTIWVVNHSGHNIQPAIRDFAPQAVRYLTEGDMRLDEVDRIKYNMASVLKDYQFDHEQDMLLLCGNIVLNVIATMVLFAYFKIPYVSILIWDRNRRFYYAKTLDPGGIDKIDLPESMYTLKTTNSGKEIPNEQG